MNPLQLMNNDMTTLLLSSKKLFTQWNDKIAEAMENKLMIPMQRNWKSYIDEMNVRMRILMNAEAEIERSMKKYKQKYGK